MNFRDVGIAFLALCVGLSASQASERSNETARVEAAPLAGMVTARVERWDKAGTYTWYRPANVDYVFAKLCGGGGGGGGGFSLGKDNEGNKHASAGGGGGAGSPIAVSLIGPLTSGTYTIVVGSGGAGGKSANRFQPPGTIHTAEAGKDGQPTSIQTADGSRNLFEARGAEGGQPASMGPGIAITVAARSGTSEQPQGGGTNEAGRAHLTRSDNGSGAGGERTESGFSGGGGGGLGNGGKGGAGSKDGEAGGACAGGGGAGYLRKPSHEAIGGKGGDGYVELVPLISLEVVSNQLEALLRQLSRNEH